MNSLYTYYYYKYYFRPSELVIAQQINWSIKGNFFIGSLPPVSTMLYAQIAKFLGYNGNESILYPGQSITYFPLNCLRLFSLILNSLTIPSSYLAVYSLNRNHMTAFFTAFLLTFGNIYNYKYILRTISLIAFYYNFIYIKKMV